VIRVLVSAAEPSADAHAAAVVRAIAARRDDAEIEGIGGPQMARAGARLFGGMDALSVVGLTEALGSLGTHMRLLRETRRRLARHSYDVAVLVDYPGMHLRVLAAAARRGVPVVYYIAPQVWAWGSWRLATLRRAHHVAVVLPFEEAFFAERGVRATFVGHPLLDRPAPPSRRAARHALGLEDGVPVLALFPGSRANERRALWPVFARAARRLRHAVPDLELLVAAPAGSPGPRDPSGSFRVTESAMALAAADAALCKSGTTTLEAAIAGTPMVVAYRLSPLTFAVARRAVRVPFVSLVNLIAGRAVVPEFLQGKATAPALAQALLPLLDRDGSPAAQQRAALADVRAALGSPGASDRVADLALRCAA